LVGSSAAGYILALTQNIPPDQRQITSQPQLSYCYMQHLYCGKVMMRPAALLPAKILAAKSKSSNAGVTGRF